MSSAALCFWHNTHKIGQHTNENATLIVCFLCSLELTLEHKFNFLFSCAHTFLFGRMLQEKLCQLWCYLLEIYPFNVARH